jgi:hypothetical protein
VLHKIITRTIKLLTRRGVLVEEEGSTYVADNDGDSDEAITRPALANERVQTNAAGQVVLKLKTQFQWRLTCTQVMS